MATQQEIDECTELTEKLFFRARDHGHKLKDPKSILSRVINHLLKRDKGAKNSSEILRRNSVKISPPFGKIASLSSLPFTCESAMCVNT